MHKLLALLAVTLCVAIFAADAFAQEADPEDGEESVPVSSAARRELQSQAAAEAPKTADRETLAVFHHQRGVAHQRLGNYVRSIEDLRIALEHSSPKTEDGWGARFRIQGDLGIAYKGRGDRFGEIEHWQAVAQEYRGSNRLHYFNAQLHLVDVHSQVGQWPEAERARAEADALLPKLRNTRGWANQEFSVLAQHARFTGLYFERQGNHREAERRLRASLPAADRNVESRRSRLGDSHQGTRSAIQARGRTMRMLARILATQGKYGEAEIVARDALRETRVLFEQNTLQVSTALGAIGWTRFQQGDLAGAERYYRQALAAIQGSGAAPSSRTIAARRATLGNVLLAQGRWTDTLKVFEERHEALRADEVQFKRLGSNHVSWAYALHRSGDSRRAADMAERSVASRLKEPLQDRWGLAQRRGVLGIALAGAGRKNEALQAFRESIPDLVRRDQEDTQEESTGYWRVFWQRAILEGYLDLLAAMHAAGEAAPGIDLVDESFRIADIARGSVVQEAISATAARAQIPDPDLAALARREQDARNRVLALGQLLTRLAEAPEEQRLNKVISDMRAEIERLRKEQAQLRADIRRRFPEYAELTDPRPAGLNDIRKALAPGEALVAIYLGDVHSYVWTVGAGGKSAFRIVPVKRQDIERHVRELRRAVDFGDGNPARLRAFDLARAHQLYRALLEPDETLWKDAQLLNVVPHGALGELPFALLVTAVPAGAGDAAYRDAPWLARRAAIAQLPSAAALVALRRAPAGKGERQPFIGFGDPVFTAASSAGAQAGAVRSLVIRKAEEEAEGAATTRGGGVQPVSVPAIRTLADAFSRLSPLPDTSAELKEIAGVLKADAGRDVYVSSRATEKNLKELRLSDRRVLAFATHGVAPGEMLGLDQPALVLSNPALTGDTGNDGFLTMEEVLALKLDADWVVLSACNTASADGRGSEAVSGLGRAFFYAGARSLLVSNWAVETTSTRLLTTELFRRQAENPKLTRAEALRQSMLDLMGKSGPGGIGYAHPAFWAPFTLVGDGGR
jgi:CHAT domain-containing protein